MYGMINKLSNKCSILYCEIVVRIAWLILMVTVLVGCGQPLQIDTRAASARPSQRAPSFATVTSGFGTPSALPGTGMPGTSMPATQPPTVAATPTLPPTLNALSTATAPIAPLRPTVVVVPQQPALSNEERWRAQQIDRTVFPEMRVYVARRPTQLFWYDPLAGQSLPVGTLLGPFTAQAEFMLRSADAHALEVPYKINSDFGLTSIAPSVKQRMARAGYTEYVETYVLLSDDVVQQK